MNLNTELNNKLTKTFYLSIHLSSILLFEIIDHLKTIFEKEVPKLKSEEKYISCQFFRMLNYVARFIGCCSINAFDCRPLEYFRDPVPVNFDGARFYSLRYAVCEWTGDPCHSPSIRAV